MIRLHWLEDALAAHGVTVRGSQVARNSPWDIRNSGCCSWAVEGWRDNRRVNVFSFDSLTRLNRCGFDVMDCEAGIELVAKA